MVVDLKALFLRCFYGYVPVHKSAGPIPWFNTNASQSSPLKKCSSVGLTAGQKHLSGPAIPRIKPKLLKSAVVFTKIYQNLN